MIGGKVKSRCDFCTVPVEVRRNTHCCERCTKENPMSEKPSLEGLVAMAKTLKQIQCSPGYYQCKQVCARTEEECRKEFGEWVSLGAVQRIFFSERTSIKKRLEDLQKALDKIELTYFSVNDLVTYPSMHGKTERQFKRFMKLFSAFQKEFEGVLQLQEQLRQLLDDFGDIADYDNDDVIELHKGLREVLGSGKEGDKK